MILFVVMKTPDYSLAAYLVVVSCQLLNRVVMWRVPKTLLML